jgi:peptidoglycan hydrolase-like protein with peptidoglycan-binding domain
MSKLAERRWLLIGGATVAGVLVVVLLLAVFDNGSSSTDTTTATEAAAAAVVASDPAVVDLQRIMTRLGYYDGPIDGIYGDSTTAAVKKMQTALGVDADGVYGPATASALQSKGKEVVVKIQTELATYGYYTGPIDGDYGTATKNAVKALQTDLGVTADGLVGAATIEAFHQAVADGTLTAPTTTTTATTTAATTTTTTTATTP